MKQKKVLIAEENGEFLKSMLAAFRGFCFDCISIPKNGEIGLEVHNDTDQFLRVESGKGIVKMGSCRDKMNFHKYIGAGDTVFVPAGTWHNIINTGDCPIKIYSIYAPPKHPHGTVHKTKEIAEAEGD